MDPHRPFVDDVTFPCPQCGDTARRVPEVIDGWYDSGAMPFAALGYPHRSQEAFADQYPADFICEAIDQTRGWFYTLMAVGTLVFDQSSYRNVVCLGHILDEDGRKMSKHLGNILAPIPLMDEHGADAVRWFMLASGSPWQARRVGHSAIADVVRKVLLTYWNSVSFQSLYARTAGWTPDAASRPVDERPVLDRWLLSETSRLARDVDTALEAFDTQRAGRLLAEFVDDLSNWYVRRSRRRFWEGDPDALATLHEALRTLTLCLAPFVPFITERVWQDLFRPSEPSGPTSVHLADWPTPGPVDDALAAHMGLVRRLVELGRAARATSSVRTRQPLGRALVSAAGWEALPNELRAQVAEELNVETLAALEDEGLVDVAVKAQFRALGRRFAQRTPEVAAAITAAEPSALVAALRSHGTAHVPVDGLGDVAITLDDVIVTETPREGWAVATGDGESVALDLHVDERLRRAGLARELVRAIQEGRKGAGLDVSDRIRVRWRSDDPEIRRTIDDHGPAIAADVLAEDVAEGTLTGAPVVTDLPVQVWLERLATSGR
jgi:isoleucyl-tRNA synthetase